MQRTEGELCAAAEAGRTRAAEGNNRQDNFSPLKSDGSHFSFREKSWRADSIYGCQSDDQAIDEVLNRAEQGQQVLWIENTVAEAQAQFQRISTFASGIECGLLHSRFLKTDRAENEGYWVKLYGKENAQQRQTKGRILVGTQVLEQSLDIDADFLISRLAPTDMLLQRLGRLWRHENTVRPAEAKREAWLLVPELNAAIENAEQEFGKTAYVYSPYVLCRSLEVWHGMKSVSLPGQIREVIEATYIEHAETGTMQVYKSKLEKKRGELKQPEVSQLLNKANHAAYAG